jgi:hypothetical protein
MRLKGLNEHPLLNPPAIDALPGWARMGDGDARLMSGSLRLFRADKFQSAVSEMAFGMGILGLPVQLTEDDMKLMRETLQKPGADGWKISEVHYYLREFGVPAQVTEDEARDMQKILQTDRSRRDGWSVAGMLFRMRALGMTAKVTDDDKKLMVEALKRARLKKESMNVAQMHRYMRAFGMTTDFTLEDMRVLQDALYKFRSEGNGWAVANLLSQAKQLLTQVPGTQNGPSMPPLKRFGGGV